MNKNYILIIFTIAVGFLCSCEKQESVNKTEYIMHCLMIEGEDPKIKVCRTIETFRENPFNLLYYDELYYYDKEYEDNAVSFRMNKDGVITDEVEKVNVKVEGTPSYTPSALYADGVQYFTFRDLGIQPGNKFELEVDIFTSERGNRKLAETLRARTVIPERVSMHINQLENVNLDLYGRLEEFYAYNISFQDIPNQDDYYYLLVYNVNRYPYYDDRDIDFDSVDLDSLWMEYRNYNRQDYYPEGDYSLRRVIIEDEGEVRVHGLDLDNSASLNGILFSDHLFDGRKKEIRFEYNDYYRGYLIFELYHVNEEFFRYYYSLAKQNQTQLDIYSEPVQLYTNVENGLGVFAGASVSRQIVKIE